MRNKIDLANLELRELTPDRVDDFLDYFDGDAFADNPDGASCYCCYFHWVGADDEDWSTRTAAVNRAWKTELIRSGETTGILAYLNNHPTGFQIHRELEGDMAGIVIVRRNLTIQNYENSKTATILG